MVSRRKPVSRSTLIHRIESIGLILRRSFRCAPHLDLLAGGDAERRCSPSSTSCVGAARTVSTYIHVSARADLESTRDTDGR